MARTAIVPAPDLNLDATLFSGQAFRWRKDGEWFRGCIAGMPVRIRMKDHDLVAEWAAGQGAGPEACSSRLASLLHYYFDLDRDYAAIRDAAVRRHPVLREAMEFSSGLRVLRQDPWEALASFIISAFNNVPRITRIVCGLCCGDEPFPSPGELARAGEDNLRRLGLGYRAPYLIAAAKMVDSGDLDLEGLRVLPTEEARRRLLAVPGVGGKVADCALLYGLQKYDVVPVDVWIKRTIEALFFGGREMSPVKVRAWAVENLGPYAGIVQACLFHYARSMRLR